MRTAPRPRSGLRRWLLIGGTAVVLVAVFRHLDLAALGRAVSRIDPASLALCAAANAAQQACIAGRWAVLAAPTGQAPALGEACVSLHANLYNLITPAAVGADVYRIADTAGRSRGHVSSAGLVLVERALGVLAQSSLFVLAFAALAVSGHLGCVSREVGRALWLGLPAFAALWLAALALLLGFRPLALRLSEKSGRFARLLEHAAPHALYGRRWLLALLSAAAAAGWVLNGLALRGSAGLDLDLAALTMVVIATEFARLVPLSIQGIGIREAVFAWLAGGFGAAAEPAVAVCALMYAVNALVQAGLGVAAAAWLNNRVPALNTMEPP